MTSARPAYEIEWHPAAADDLAQLDGSSPALGDAALAAVDDVANHRKRGKPLGSRHTTGDLTGYYRVKFDLPGKHPQRYRLIYAHTDSQTVQIWAIGERAGQSVYSRSVSRD